MLRRASRVPVCSSLTAISVSNCASSSTKSLFLFNALRFATFNVNVATLGGESVKEGKIGSIEVKVGDEVECKVLEVDSKGKRISLGLKQLMANPWDELEVRYPVGTIVEDAEVKSVTDFGVFVDVGLGIDGLIHVSDVSWTKKVTHPSERFKKGEKVRAVVLGIDKPSEKFSLGLKQLERDPWENIRARYRQGQSIDGVITKVTDFGAFVELEEGVEGLIYVSELADQRVEKPSDVAKIGDTVRAEILSIEPKERRISLSIRQLKKSEERANYESFVGERSEKTSMGDILGEKLKAAMTKEKDE